MKLTRLQAILGGILAAIAVAGYAFDAGGYYQPQAEADQQHAAMASWNELDSIEHRLEVLQLKIQRIIDMAAIERRPLTEGEDHEIASLREEIRLHNDRRNSILAGAKK